MNTKNFLIGGIVGGVAYFLLGWLFYGILLNQFFADNPGSATNVHKAMDQFEWWALILGNLLFGFLLAYVFSKAGVSSLASGLTTGAIIGFLLCSSIDLTMYGASNILSKRAMVADIATFTVMSALAGAIIAAVIGKLNRTGTATTTSV